MLVYPKRKYVRPLVQYFQYMLYIQAKIGNEGDISSDNGNADSTDQTFKIVSKVLFYVRMLGLCKLLY